MAKITTWTVRKFVSFLFLTLKIELALCTNQGDVLHKSCTTSGTFKSMFNISFPDCIEECHRRQRCEFIMYKQGINECSLKDSIDVTALAEGVPVCLFANADDWERTGLGPCDKNRCGITETCVQPTTNSEQFVCMPSECPSPDEKSNAEILSDVHAIGSKNYYKCDPTYIGVGSPYIICKNDGTWTSTNFVCGKNGNSPMVAVFNADLDLQSVTGEKWVTGTSITYTCRPNYQGLGTSATSVVNSKGEWNPSWVHCCNEHISEFAAGGNCVAGFNGSFASTMADMKAHCINIGGYMRLVDNWYAKRVFESHNFRWLLSGMTKQETRELLDHCLTANNVMDNFSSYTYGQLATEVVSRGFKSPWQCFVPGMWAPNEPNGGDDEQCMIFRNESNDAMDVDCSTWIPAEAAHTGFICAFLLPKINV